MAMYAKCPKGHEVKVNDMAGAAPEWPQGKFSQGQYRESDTPVVCAECGDCFVPMNLYVKG